MSGSLGLIVGSGFELLGLDVVARSPTKTPFGPPSSPVLTVICAGSTLLCLARHGESHAIAPHEVNYRANVWALHRHGVRRLVGVNAVGAIAAGFDPGDLAVPDQLIDYTYGRIGTFAENGGEVRHVAFSEPFEPVLRGRLASAVLACGLNMHGGTYGVTQGPRLETAAEIERLSRDGCAMVGMTAMPEAVLARELDVDYAICALAVNYAAGRSPAGVGIHAEMRRWIGIGMERVRQVLERLVADLAQSAM
jgi:5'-methylthioinosine phosphorylase